MLKCVFKFPTWDNDLPHELHLWSFWQLRTESICVFIFPRWENDFSHDIHLWSLWPLSIVILPGYHFGDNMNKNFKYMTNLWVWYLIVWHLVHINIYFTDKYIIWQLVVLTNSHWINPISLLKCPLVWQICWPNLQNNASELSNTT